MPITITIDQDHSQELTLELEARRNPDPRLLHIAVMVLEAINSRLQHDPERCPACHEPLETILPLDDSTTH